ncbi:hypothetical protein ANANG_G00287010, partial [Anguilla anguilla]
RGHNGRSARALSKQQLKRGKADRACYVRSVTMASGVCQVCPIVKVICPTVYYYLVVVWCIFSTQRLSRDQDEEVTSLMLLLVEELQIWRKESCDGKFISEFQEIIIKQYN